MVDFCVKQLAGPTGGGRAEVFGEVEARLVVALGDGKRARRQAGSALADDRGGDLPRR